MGGTYAGGAKAAATNKAKDPDFYVKIGAKGGAAGRTGGFYNNPEAARLAGMLGGRPKHKNPEPFPKSNVTPTQAQSDTLTA